MSLSLRRKSFGATGLLLGLSFLALTGCASETRAWVGTWEGERKGLTLPEKEDALAKALRRVVIVIAPDGSFTREETSLGSRGKGRFSAKQAFLTVTHLLDKPIETDPNVARENKDLILEWKDENTILYWDPGSLTPGSVELKRVAPAQ